MSLTDQDYIRECIAIASQTMESGNPPFASILVINDEIVAHGMNSVNSDSNFMKHGEMNLLSNALESVGADKLSTGVVYAIGEPCPMCASAIYWSGVSKVVYGARRTALRDVRKFGLNMRPEEIYATGTREIEVVGPVLEEEAVALYMKFYEK